MIETLTPPPQVNLGIVPLLCACDHPNLVRVCGFIRHSRTNHTFLVSQFVEGKSLAERLVSAEGRRGRWGGGCMSLNFHSFFCRLWTSTIFMSLFRKIQGPNTVPVLELHLLLDLRLKQCIVCRS